MKNFFVKIIFLCTWILAATVSAEPFLYCDSAIVIESSTGRVIYEKNADKIYPPASMTKMLTCILAIENLSPATEIKISREVQNTEYSDLHLMEGDIISAEDLLTGMMLVSDNGGAVAVAEKVGGNVKNFVNMMNKKLLEIGCTETHFANPNGLPDPDHVSTARDISKIAAYCMRNDRFREIVGTLYATVYWISPAGHKVDAMNTNELFNKYEVYIIGGRLYDCKRKAWRY